MFDDLDSIGTPNDKDWKNLDIKASLTERVPVISDEYGVCSTCVHLTLIKTKYGKEFAWCDWHDKLKPNTVDPIVFCIHHSPRNQLSLKEMWTLATIINVDKNKVGFDV